MGGVERFGGGADAGAVQGNGHANGAGNEWEFVEPKVPEGISLRNFGIQAVSSSAFGSLYAHMYGAEWALQ